MTRACNKALSWAAADSIESFTEGYRPRGFRYYSYNSNALDWHDWWDDTNVSGLDDPEALGHFLYNCDYPLEDWDSKRESSQIIPWCLGR
jgi:hypothetical protein